MEKAVEKRVSYNYMLSLIWKRRIYNTVNRVRHCYSSYKIIVGIIVEKGSIYTFQVFNDAEKEVMVKTWEALEWA